MKKLTQEQIQFIDNYLKNSDVVFIDVRLEMLDHVASAVETKMEEEQTDFYEAFKAYMVVNKKELIESTSKHRWDLDKKALKLIGKNMIHPIILGFFILVLGIIYLIGFKAINVEYLLIPQAILGSFVILPLLIYRYLKVSFIHHLVLLIYLFNSIAIHWGIRINEKNEAIFMVVALISLWINASALKTIIENFLYYKVKFKES